MAHAALTRRFVIVAGVVAVVAVGGAVALPRMMPQADAAGLLPSLVMLILLALAVGLGWLWRSVAGQIGDRLTALAGEARIAAHANRAHRIDEGDYAALAPLPAAINELAAALGTAEERVAGAVEDATARVEEQKSRLGAILNLLHQGVVVCTAKHRILLYNEPALRLLHVTGDLGLNRPLFSVLTREPVVHTLDRLTNRVREGRHPNHPRGVTAPLVCGSTDGRYILEGQMSLILGPDGAITGYVLTFEDATEELAALGRRDALLRLATEGLRGPVAALRAATETLEAHPDLSAEARAGFDAVVIKESAALSSRLDWLAQEVREVMTASWPMSDLYSSNLLGAVARRLQELADLQVTLTGLPCWLHADGHSLSLGLERLARHVHGRTGQSHFDLAAEDQGARIYLDLAWEGAPIPSAMLDDWLNEPLAEALGGLTTRDVLDHHRSDIWSEPLRNGRARLRLPLPPALEPPHPTRRQELPPRPEFFDFDLVSPPEVAGDLAAMPLRAVTYVVFDTETTGLRPSEGDEIISIAGVRIVNGRILTGETFSRLVNPGRTIPKESIRFHGITDDMVADKPPIQVALRQFHAYAQDAVLVAHNAAFDMKFLKLKERQCDVRFDNAVLDTLLLSAFLHDQALEHSLDGVAARLGVPVTERHTALGDAMVTAAVFVALLDLLEARGLTTLGAVLERCNMVAELRAREGDF